VIRETASRDTDAAETIAYNSISRRTPSYNF